MIVRGGGLCWQNLGDTSPSRSLGFLLSAPRLTVMKPECVFLPLSLFQDSCEKQCFCHANYSSSCLDSAPGLSHSHPYSQPQPRHPAHRGLLESSDFQSRTHSAGSELVATEGHEEISLSQWRSPEEGRRWASGGRCWLCEDEGLGPSGRPWYPCLVCCPIRCVGTSPILHLTFPPFTTVIIQLSLPFLILSLKKPVWGKAPCLSEKHIL